MPRLSKGEATTLLSTLDRLDKTGLDPSDRMALDAIACRLMGRLSQADASRSLGKTMRFRSKTLVRQASIKPRSASG